MAGFGMSLGGLPLEQIPPRHRDAAGGILTCYDEAHFNPSPSTILTPEIAQTINWVGDEYTTMDDYTRLSRHDLCFGDPPTVTAREFFDFVRYLRRYSPLRKVVKPVSRRGGLIHPPPLPNRGNRQNAENPLTPYLRDYFSALVCAGANPENELDQIDMEKLSDVADAAYRAIGEPVDLDRLEQITGFLNRSGYCSVLEENNWKPWLYEEIEKQWARGEVDNRGIFDKVERMETQGALKPLNGHEGLIFWSAFMAVYESWDNGLPETVDEGQ